MAPKDGTFKSITWMDVILLSDNAAEKAKFMLCLDNIFSNYHPLVQTWGNRNQL
jgi:hypothetical protein